MSRIFANEVAELAVQTALKILSGSGMFDMEVFGDFMDKTSCDELSASYNGIIKDMDIVADFLFERKKS